MAQPLGMPSRPQTSQTFDGYFDDSLSSDTESQQPGALPQVLFLHCDADYACVCVISVICTDSSKSGFPLENSRLLQSAADVPQKVTSELQVVQFPLH